MEHKDVEKFIKSSNEIRRSIDKMEKAISRFGDIIQQLNQIEFERVRDIQVSNKLMYQKEMNRVRDELNEMKED